MQEVEVLHMTAMCGQTMDEMLEDMLTDLSAQLVVITEDVLHSLCLKKLKREQTVRVQKEGWKQKWRSTMTKQLNEVTLLTPGVRNRCMCLWRRI